jgi:hypothetical protein
LVLAHGALGNFDELLFVLIGIIFVGLMVFAWLRSRSSKTTPANAQGPATPGQPGQPGADEAATSDKSDHFPLA